MSIKLSRAFILSGFLLLGIGIAPLCYGEVKVTPSHVAQVARQLNKELELLNAANFSDIGNARYSLTITARKPRHVLQKAREVAVMLQALRELNGLAAEAPPSIPIQKILPAHVKASVDVLLIQARELRSVFGVKEEASTVALVPGESPSHVYARLSRSLLLINLLGVPASVPNDVHQLVLTLNNEIKAITPALGVKIPTRSSKRSTGKSPLDAYNKAYQVIDQLKILSEQGAKFSIPGGITPPERFQGAIKPSNVLNILNNILAEIGAIKLQLKLTKAITIAEQPVGKTPSNVFDGLSYSLKMVETISSAF